MASIITVVESGTPIYAKEESKAIILAQSYQLLSNMGSISLYSGALGGTPVLCYGSFATHPDYQKLGDEYWNTTDSKFYKYNGTDWIPLS